MSVKVYVDLRSQPCRALTLFLKHSDIPYELEYMELMNGDHMTPEFLSHFPRHKVPAIQDGDFYLAESVAIFRYLTTKYAGQFPDHWYPADLKARARVDEYLAFHPTGTRSNCFQVFIDESFETMITGKPVPEARLAHDLERYETGLDTIQTFLVDSDFLCGDDISFADALAVCEFMHLTVNGRDVTEGRPLLKAYVERVKSRLNPLFDEIHEKLYDWRDTYLKKSSGKMNHTIRRFDNAPKPTL